MNHKRWERERAKLRDEKADWMPALVVALPILIAIFGMHVFIFAIL